VVTAAVGADVSATFSVLVGVAWVTEKLVRAVLVLVAKFAGVVGVNTAVRDSAPTGSVVLARVADPAVTVTADPIATLLL
jgi:hypothetical protein